MKLRKMGTILIGLSSLISFSLFAADIEAGKAKSAVCAGCHGVDGNSVSGTWPTLAGQFAGYTVKQLKDFKSGDRADPTMKGMASILATEQDMQNVAAYYESQKRKTVSFDKSLVAQGETIYRGGIADASIPACMSCHSPTGSGNGPAGFPSVKSQHPEYLASQLKKFRDGSRANDSAKLMRNIAARMSDKEIMAVSAYIAGLK